MNSDKKILVISFLGLSAIVLFPVWYFKYQPLQEYANHLLVVFSLKELHTIEFGFDRFFLPDYFPYPNLLAYGVIRFFASFTTITIAGKLFLSLYLLALPLSVLYFLRSLERERGILALAAFLMTRTWVYHSGYINFLAGLPFFFLALGLFERSHSKRTFYNSVIMTVLAICIYFSSLLLFIASFLAILLISFFSVDRIRRVKFILLSYIPALVLLLVYAIRFLESFQIGKPVFVHMITSIKNLAAYSFFSFSKLDLLVMIIPLALLGVATIIALLGISRGAGNTDRIKKRYIGLFAFIAVLYSIFPISIGGWWPINILLISFLLIFPMTFIAYPRSQGIRLVFSGLILFFVTAQTIILFLEYSPIDSQFRQFELAWEMIPRGSVVLPVIEDGHGTSENTEPYLYFWVPYHLEKGGVGPYFFAYPRLETNKTPLRYKDFFSLPNPGLFGNDRVRFEKAIVSNVYDYIIVFGGSKHMDLISSAYVPIGTYGDMEIFKRMDHENEQ